MQHQALVEGVPDEYLSIVDRLVWLEGHSRNRAPRRDRDRTEFLAYTVQVDHKGELVLLIGIALSRDEVDLDFLTAVR